MEALAGSSNAGDMTQHGLSKSPGDLWARTERWASERPLLFGLVTGAAFALGFAQFLRADYAALLGGVWFLVQGVRREAIRRERARREP